MRDAAEKMLVCREKHFVLAMTKDVCYSGLQSISPKNDKMENNIGCDGCLEDAKIFESHPGAEGGADQHTDQHHDLLPIRWKWLSVASTRTGIQRCGDIVLGKCFEYVTCGPSVGTQELSWCRWWLGLCILLHSRHGHQFWEKSF